MPSGHKIGYDKDQITHQVSRIDYYIIIISSTEDSLEAHFRKSGKISLAARASRTACSSNGIQDFRAVL